MSPEEHNFLSSWWAETWGWVEQSQQEATGSLQTPSIHDFVSTCVLMRTCVPRNRRKGLVLSPSRLAFSVFKNVCTLLHFFSASVVSLFKQFQLTNYFKIIHITIDIRYYGTLFSTKQVLKFSSVTCALSIWRDKRVRDTTPSPVWIVNTKALI